MKIRMLVPAVAAVAALGATPAVASAAPAPSTASRQATATQAAAVDAAWLVAAAGYDLGEIAAGKLAQQKATTAGVAGLGAMFVKDHTAHIALVRKLAAARDVTLPTAPPAPAAAALQTLADAPAGIGWDRNWVRNQLSGHRATLIATGKARLVSRDPAVLDLERKTLPVVKLHHLELLGAYLIIAPPATSAS